MGYDRTLQPEAPPVVISFDDAFEAEIDRLIGRAMPPRDPFEVADRCPVNPTGHDGTMSCGEIVCPHCGCVFWS